MSDQAADTAGWMTAGAVVMAALRGAWHVMRGRKPTGAPKVALKADLDELRRDHDGLRHDHDALRGEHETHMREARPLMDEVLQTRVIVRQIIAIHDRDRREAMTARTNDRKELLEAIKGLGERLDDRLAGVERTMIELARGGRA